MREFSGYCPMIPPISEQSNGSKQGLVLRQRASSDDNRNIFDPAALELYPSTNSEPNHTRRDDGCSADNCFDNRDRDSKFQIQSNPTMKTKPNCIRIEKDGFEIEQQWIEEYQGGLTIWMDEHRYSNCK